MAPYWAGFVGADGRVCPPYSSFMIPSIQQSDDDKRSEERLGWMRGINVDDDRGDAILRDRTSIPNDILLEAPSRTFTSQQSWGSNGDQPRSESDPCGIVRKQAVRVELQNHD
jgi:hypothetical protein